MTNDPNNELDNTQLELNQRFIDLTYEYLDSIENQKNYYVDPKELLKWLWNKGYKIRERQWRMALPF